MDFDSIECMSSSDGLDKDEIHQHHINLYSHPHPHHAEFSTSELRNNGVNNIAIVSPTTIAPATSVHELVDCPICTNFMYLPIHQAFQLGMAPVHMAFLGFVGDENDARNYSYSLEVGANGRKLIWEGTPRSIRDSHRKVRDSHDGLVIQRSMALFFSGSDRKELKLRVTGRIWKGQQNPDPGVCIPNLCG